MVAIRYAVMGGTPRAMAVRTSYPCRRGRANRRPVRSSTARPTFRQSRSGKSRSCLIISAVRSVFNCRCTPLRSMVNASATRGEWLDMMPAAIHPSSASSGGLPCPATHAVTVERRLDDAVQPGRSVEHAWQIHHLVDAAGLFGPPFEGECRFCVADVSAGRLDGARRRG